MGGGSQPQPSSNATTTTVSEPPDYVVPYANRFLQGASDLSKEPYIEAPNRVAALDPLHEAGLQMTTARALGGFPGEAEAYGQFQDTLGGAYLHPGANPYIDATFDRAARNVADTYRYATAPQMQAQAVRARGMDNSGYEQQQALARFGLGENLSNLATDIYGGNYQAERGRQFSALGQVPTFAELGYRDAQALLGGGDVLREYDQALTNQAYEDFERARLHPYAQTDVLGNALGMSMGGGGTTTTSQPTFYQPNRTAGALGGGLLGYGAASAFPQAGLNPWMGAGLGALGGGFMM